MSKYRHLVIFIVSFLVVALGDVVIFSSLFSRIFVGQAAWVLNNFILSLLLFFWLFIGMPAIAAYLLAFDLLKDKKKPDTDPVQTILKETGNKNVKLAIITTLILGAVVTGFIRWATQPRWLPYAFHPISPGEIREADISPLPIVTVSITHSTVPTAVVPSPSSALFSLYFNTVDHSRVDPGGEVPGAKVRLYDANTRLMGEKTVPPTTYRGNIGTGGNVLFQVPLGSYKAEAETAELFGSQEVTIDSFSDQQYYSIWMYAKGINIRGKYFYDANKNGTYDQGETIFTNKKITAFVRTGAPSQSLYTAGSTTTDDEGKFSLTVNYIGSYTLGAEQVLGYQELPQHWVDLTSGQSITYDIYLWPLN